MISKTPLARKFYNFTLKSSLFHYWVTQDKRKLFFSIVSKFTHCLPTGNNYALLHSPPPHNRAWSVWGSFHFPWSSSPLVTVFSGLHGLLLIFHVNVLSSFDTSIKIYYGFLGWTFFIESIITTYGLLCFFCNISSPSRGLKFLFSWWH